MEIRKLNRLPGYDYSQSGYYFVTIDAFDRYFGKVSDDDCLILNKFGNIAAACWKYLFSHYKYIESDEFIIMPNHVHGIIIFNNVAVNVKVPSLSTIMGTFKSLASRKIHAAGLKSFQWQRSFYDRIIRNEKELFYIRNYIRYNYLKERS